MIGIGRRATVLLAALLSVAACRHEPVRQGDEVLETSFCEVVRNPDRYDRKNVRFRARFETDGIERSSLTHPSCPYAAGIAPFVMPQLDLVADAAFHDPDLTGNNGTYDRRVSVTFTGRFIAHPAPHPLLMENPRHLLQITGISDLRVKLLTGDEASSPWRSELDRR